MSDLPGSALQNNGTSTLLQIPTAPWAITDAPSFPHRGLLVDVARTFLPISILETIVDALMYSKMNVLHIHLTDSQSFPMEVQQRPSITANGAMRADQVYTLDALQSLVQYAAERGVRLIPEVQPIFAWSASLSLSGLSAPGDHRLRRCLQIDTPGHSRAFGLAPELSSIVACANVAMWSQACAEPPCGQVGGGGGRRPGPGRCSKRVCGCCRS
jgi:hexosaminidase